MMGTAVNENETVWVMFFTVSEPLNKYSSSFCSFSIASGANWMIG